MTEPQRDLDGKERWLNSLERSRRRRAAAPRPRRNVAAHGTRAGVTLVVLLAGLGASLAIAGRPGSGSGSGQPAVTRAGAAFADGDQRDLRLGSSGSAVTAVERRLRELGYEVEVDRYFDRGTRRAVRRFQRSEGMAADGVVGPATWRALFDPDADSTVSLASRGDGSSDESRARFAVRMAAPAELAAEDRQRIGLEPSDSPGDGGPGALVAIELENGVVADGGTSESGGRAESTSAADDSSGGHEALDAPDRSDAPDRTEARTPGGNGSSAVRPTRSPAPARAGGGACGSGRMVAPVPGATPTSSYRSAHRPSHAGVDLAAPTGTPIRSVACGIVSFLAGTANSGGYGNYVCVKHSSRLTTCYAHLSRFSDERVGDRVRRGEVIGYVGSTGRSTGPHLHFETRSGNPYGRNDVDPAPYLRGRAIPGARVGSSAVGGPDLVAPAEPANAGSPFPGPAGGAAAEGSGASPPISPPGDASPEPVDGAPAIADDHTESAAESDRASAEVQANVPPRSANAAAAETPDPLKPRIGETENRPAVAQSGDSPAPADPTAPPATEEGTDSGEAPQPTATTGGPGESGGEPEDSADTPAAEAVGEPEAGTGVAPGPATEIEPPVFEDPAPALEGVDALFEPDADPVPGPTGVPGEGGQGFAEEWFPATSP